MECACLEESVGAGPGVLARDPFVLPPDSPSPRGRALRERRRLSGRAIVARPCVGELGSLGSKDGFESAELGGGEWGMRCTKPDAFSGEDGRASGEAAAAAGGACNDLELPRTPM
jgi:hypothetical protein